MSDGSAEVIERPTRPGVLAERLSTTEARRWFLFALAGFLAGQILSVVAVSIAASAVHYTGSLSSISTESTPPQWYVVSSLVGLWVGFIGAPVLASRLGPVRRHLGVGFQPIDLIGIPIGVAGQFLIDLLYAPFITHLHNFDGPVTRLTGSSHGGGLTVIAIATIFGAPFAEELFFRGLLFRSLLGFADTVRSPGRHRTATVAAVALDGLLFGLAHGELAQLAGLALFGMLLCVLVLRTGRLGMSMAAHASFNAVAIASLVVNSGTVVRWL